MNNHTPTKKDTKKDISKDADKDFIISVIQYLDYQHNITFFINTKDFDCLYNWWEKRIPMRVIRESISAVVKRWQKKNKPVSGFSNFKYEVRKNFASFLQLSLGSESAEIDTDVGKTANNNESKETKAVVADAGSAAVSQEKTDHHHFEEIDVFFNRFPEPLNPLREGFERLYDCLKEKQPIDSESLYKKLVEFFAEDTELNLKTSIFLKNLAAPLRKPELEQRYRLNWLKSKFNIADFELF